MRNDKWESRNKKLYLLIVLSAVSVALIIALWVVYLNWTLADSLTPTPQEETSAVFKSGLSVIAEKIETGFVNSYIFFYNVFNKSNTIILTP